jgi:diguanylate cyclase (GGDEF)-like protein
LAKAKKENVPIALLLLRIDHFDAVAEKDKISSLLVSYIDALLRENDILQPSSEGYFILLLFNTKPESAKIIAVRLQEKIRKQQFKVGNQKERLTISIAVSALAANETSFNKMIRSAEKSLKAHTDNSLIISIDE